MEGEGSSTGYRAAADGLAGLALLALPGDWPGLPSGFQVRSRAS